MGRPRTPIGTFGQISFSRVGRKVRARTRYRDDDGRVRRVQASGATEADAVRRLKAALAQRESRRSYGELSPDSSFTTLVKVWLEDLDLDGELARSTRDLYERDMRTIVLPAFEHLLVRETKRLRKPPTKVKALSVADIAAVRTAVRAWRRGDGLPGPRPDGQLEQIVEVMLGS